MANTHLYTEQEAMNLLYGSRPAQYTVQEVANLQYGSAYPTLYSFQRILNISQGLTPHANSEQVALWNSVYNELSLTGSKTQYSTQELLNMAYNAGVSLNDILSITDTGGSSGKPLGLLLALTSA